jgi:hypothetical protein
MLVNPNGTSHQTGQLAVSSRRNPPQLSGAVPGQLTVPSSCSQQAERERTGPDRAGGVTVRPVLLIRLPIGAALFLPARLSHANKDAVVF